MSSDEWQGRACDEDAWIAYRRHLIAEGKSPATVYAYRNALEKLSRWLPDGTTLYDMDGGHVTRWLEAGATGAGGARPWEKSSLASYSRKVRTWCLWAHRTGYAGANPMAAVRPVKENIAQIEIPDAADCAVVAAMLAKGKDFESRRDFAIVCLLAEAGTPRATELASLPLAGLDLRNDELRFWGKGGLERTIALGNTTCRALTLYLRARAAHKDAGLPVLFLGRKGPMTRHGMRQMLERRCDQAGVARIPPHHWRHLTAHAFMDAGGQVPDAMKLFGWRSPLMASRYGAAAAGTRAVRRAREMSIGDRILAGK